ncbi:uncharacterized protein [Amphiura filiformis]|uniref:uncharacterized protein n=1 Tax=Amphiura filiformis TaxID=82378 RepID=UPI003B20BCBF
MGKNHSKFGLSLAGKKRENPEGGTYVLNGCVNGRFRNSEECVWSNAATSGSPARFTITSPSTPENLKTCHQCSSENEPSPVGFAEDNCRFEVALPPEVTGSACSVKVYAMEERGDIGSICKPPLSPSTGKLPSGAVDYNVSLDRESDQQEWSFTLYDFDGHRRVTREDLSSVLKSISEALSTTVTLPPCGSKKLHLRLSVMPDKATDDQEKKKAITPLQEKDASDGTKVVTPDSKQSHIKVEQVTTPTGVTTTPTSVTTTTHVHRRHHHHHHRKDGGIRSSKRPLKDTGSQWGRRGWRLWRKKSRYHTRQEELMTTKHHSSRNKNAETPAAATPVATPAAATPAAATPAAATPAIPVAPPAAVEPATASKQQNSNSNSNSNSTSKEASTPETPCTVIVNELTTENLANHDNLRRKSDENREKKSDENRERRTYYQELAGIENTCNNDEEQPPDVLTPAQVVKAKHERTRSKHHRNGHGSPRHRRSKVYEIDLPLDQFDKTTKIDEKPKGTTPNYHMQLLEASKAKLENQQPVVPITTPQTPEDGIGDIGGAVVMHRKEQRRRHHNNGSKSKRPTTLQPFMLFEHEVTQSHDRQVLHRQHCIDMTITTIMSTTTITTIITTIHNTW